MHYHGTPITPLSELGKLAGENFCVSYAWPEQLVRAHELGQSVMLDNGAFTFWRTPGRTADWLGYYAWAEPWLDYWTTWAVVPDVIDGDAEANDTLLMEWPHGKTQAAPVWHMHEPIARLLDLCEQGWSRVCIGSSGTYKDLRSPAWYRRMDEAFNALCPTGRPPVPIHMLRGMAESDGCYPFASVDSSDIAQNHHREPCILTKARRWDGKQTPARWTYREQLGLVTAFDATGAAA